MIMANLSLFLFLAFTLFACKSGFNISSTETGRQPLPIYSQMLVYEKSAVLSDSLVAILQPVGTLSIGDKGLTIICDYHTVVDQAKSEARRMGANVIKITEHKWPGFTSSCHRIKATAYYHKNLENEADKLAWQADRPLRFEDFRGDNKIGRDSFDLGRSQVITGGMTASSIDLQVKGNTLSKNIDVLIVAQFYRKLSWIGVQSRNAYTLNHEQRHFDITEIFARKLRKAWSEAAINATNYETDGKVLHRLVLADYDRYQDLYDNATRHGMNVVAQQQWDQRIAEELAALETYAL